MSKKLREGWTRVARDQWKAVYRGISLCVQKLTPGYTPTVGLGVIYMRGCGQRRLEDAMEWAETMVDAHWTYCERMKYQRKPKKG
jgi:hypothetical protein